MRILVLGGIRSGKSLWAETLLAGAVPDPEPVRYLATGPAPAQDAEWADRVTAHRQRRCARWSTVESSEVSEQLRAEPVATLVDDVGSWLRAAMDAAGAWSGGSVRAQVDELLTAVGEFAAPLALVSPEVGLTVVPATTSGRLFADELGSLNQRLAALCDRVVLVVAGHPIAVKEPR